MKLKQLFPEFQDFQKVLVIKDGKEVARAVWDSAIVKLYENMTIMTIFSEDKNTIGVCVYDRKGENKKN